MLRKTVCLALTATAVALLTASQAHAWGAYHVGYTHFGAYGVQHYGRTAAVGPYGAYSGHRAYGGYGGYGYGAHYGGAMYGGYHYGAGTYSSPSSSAFRSEALYGGYSSGYHRRW